MRVKICGVNSEAAIDAVREAGADWAGFVFFAASPRHVTPKRAAELAARCGNVALVGLFVDPDDAAIEAALAAVRLDALQLYATAERVAAIQGRFSRPVWRAIGVSAVADLPDDAQGADALVIEPRPPTGATRPGGNATALNWAMLSGFSPGVPWLLAGGLSTGNVADAIGASGARAVDVSSGVESAPGVKDPALIHAFVAAARG